MRKTDRRTQIYLPADQHDRVLTHAHATGTSMAGVIREALGQYLAAAGDRGVDWEGDPMLDLLGALELPPYDAGSLDEAIDASVYDDLGESR